ncbi:type II secretion system protein [Clostridium botulinum C]|uniref:Type II secretion system protein n=3 Tax=Clostridium botulinum TaxID=1491 RepID=A0A9Q4TGG2_CLOBO|nr:MULTISPECIES: type II secretion system protein [Clostridium]AYF54953.1 type II secretion system protein [Clostridium novyi]EES91807.1 prepilin-type N-terminal cleavage/methylation domain protein [Clostridium botulinum D str. 1873]KEI10597.1 N-terminal cleavage protein [Clostridium sp. K25]MBO3441951.1 type II secretion system protein [Clostridium haemolyticum]MCD3194160.1 type II secretion system protein [Clostridium botulinum C]
MKKGYSLIEVLFSICILSIIFAVEINMLLKENFRYKRNVIEDREECYCTSALEFIENEINDAENKRIIIDENSIILQKLNGDINKIDSILRGNGEGKVRIIYDKAENHKTVYNIIVEGIKKFTILKRKNVIFISIESLKGRNFEKCIGLRKESQVL